MFSSKKVLRAEAFLGNLTDLPKQKLDLMKLNNISIQLCKFGINFSKEGNIWKTKIFQKPKNEHHIEFHIFGLVYNHSQNIWD